MDSTRIPYYNRTDKKFISYKFIKRGVIGLWVLSIVALVIYFLDITTFDFLDIFMIVAQFIVLTIFFIYIKKEDNFWYVNLKKEEISIRDEFIYIPKHLKYSDIRSFKKIVTGDLEIKTREKTYTINKDMVTEDDFLKIITIIENKTNIQ